MWREVNRRPANSRVSRPSTSSATSSRSRALRPCARESSARTSSGAADRKVTAIALAPPSTRPASTTAQPPSVAAAGEHGEAVDVRGAGVLDVQARQLARPVVVADPAAHQQRVGIDEEHAPALEADRAAQLGDRLEPDAVEVGRRIG